jgi:hypothetical protein
MYKAKSLPHIPWLPSPDELPLRDQLARAGTPARMPPELGRLAGENGTGLRRLGAKMKRPFGSREVLAWAGAQCCRWQFRERCRRWRRRQAQMRGRA